MNAASSIDTLWVMLAAMLVFAMNLGFAALETGLARSKNAVNILSKNFIVFSVSSLGFTLLGWGLMFGGGGSFIGTSHLSVLGGGLEFYDDTLTSDVPFWGKFFFQLVFCGTAATIVSGAVAERVKYISFILFSFVLTLIVYPVAGRWIWGGGWLAQMGFLDFAGDTTVHSLGGWAALSGALILGPRHGKYDRDGRPQAIPGHSMPLAVIGLFILWLGWFGFNPGSTMSLQNPADAAHILAATNMAAIAGLLTSTAAAWLFLGKPDLSMTINGCLAGLVGITGGCAFVSMLSSLIIGALAGVIVVFSVIFIDRRGLDDPVGATSVHLVCGVFGTLAIGLFAQEGVTSLSTVNGLFFGGGSHLLGIQALGAAAVGVFAFVASSLVWLALKKTIGIRVSLAEEMEGLDLGEHGNVAYPDFVAAAPVLDLGDERPPAGGGGGKAEEKDGTAGVREPGVREPGVREPAGRPAAQARPGPKMTRATIITRLEKLAELHVALERIGVTGLTVTSVLGHGMQKGHTDYYRGVPVKAQLLPHVQVDVVISKVPTPTLIETVKKALYTGKVGDGKIFVHDVENVIKIRTGEEGYDALQDEL